ncbi:unnamed protein product, partial [Prorocentrum cordatum]
MSGHSPSQWFPGRGIRLPRKLLGQHGNLRILQRALDDSEPSFRERMNALSAAQRSAAALEANREISEALLATSRASTTDPETSTHQVGDQALHWRDLGKARAKKHRAARWHDSAVDWKGAPGTPQLGKNPQADHRYDDSFLSWPPMATEHYRQPQRPTDRRHIDWNAKAARPRPTPHPQLMAEGLAHPPEPDEQVASLPAQSTPPPEQLRAKFEEEETPQMHDDGDGEPRIPDHPDPDLEEAPDRFEGEDTPQLPASHANGDADQEYEVDLGAEADEVPFEDANPSAIDPEHGQIDEDGAPFHDSAGAQPWHQESQGPTAAASPSGAAGSGATPFRSAPKQQRTRKKRFDHLDDAPLSIRKGGPQVVGLGRRLFNPALVEIKRGCHPPRARDALSHCREGTRGCHLANGACSTEVDLDTVSGDDVRELPASTEGGREEWVAREASR